jgi:hypothetical protein
MKTATSEAKKEKAEKIRSIADRISDVDRRLFSPTKYIKIDDKLVNLLCGN